MKLILIRGLPGSGKSTIARALAKGGFEHFEADTFYLNGEGEYCFDRTKTKDAHEWCQRETFKALSNGGSVVVSNTFTQLWELAPYFEMAKSFGIEPNVIEAKGVWDNVHQVPDSVLKNMRDRWEELK